MLTKEQFKKAISQGKKYCVLKYLKGVSIVLLKNDLDFDNITMLGEWELVITTWNNTKIFIDDAISVDRIVEMIDENGFYNWVLEHSLVDGGYELIK